LAHRQAADADAMFVELGKPSVTLTSVLAIVWRQRLAFLAAALVTFAIAAAFITSLRPRYESEALLMVDPRQTNITNLQSIQDSSTTLSDLNFVRSQMQILTSDELARRVVEDMKLQDDPAFASPPSGLAALTLDVRRWLGLPPPAVMPSAHPLDEAVGQYQSRFGAFSDGKSFIISASFSAADPAFAQRVLQRHLALFQASQIVAKRKVITSAEAWFASELETLHAKLLAEESRQQAFLQESDLIKAGGETIPSRQLTAITNQLTDARVDLQRKEARYRELSGGAAGGSDTALLSSDLLQNLREQEAAAAQNVARLQGTAGDRNPALVAARAAVADLTGRIARETARLNGSAASDVAIARANVARLEAALGSVNTRLSATSKDELTAAQLNRDIEADRRLYDDLLLRSKQVSIQGQLQEPDMQVVSAPTLPLTPSFPRRTMLLGISAMAAAVVGALAAFAADLLRAGRATSLRAIEASCGVAGLAVIPRLKRSERRGAGALPRPGSHLAAALQTLRNSIAFRCADQNPKVTVFASAQPDEGKTLLATLYARSLTGGGGRILLVDADLRRLGITRATAKNAGGKDAGGLAAFMAGRPLADCVVADIVAGLDILPTGRVAADPGALLASDRVRHLLAAASGYAAIVIDTPPLAVVDDALHPIAQADATVLVARWNRTTLSAIQNALNRLSLAGGQMVGVALTDTDMKKYRSGADSPRNFAKQQAYYITAS
jgi:capsular exopolysaccharide synthesis family protein